MNEKIDKVIEIAKKMNERLMFDIIDVPILEGYVVQKNTVKNVVFVAVSGNKSIEQLIFDSVLKENESIEEKIEEVVKNTKIYMEENGLETSEDSLYFYKEYKGMFDYKIYKQNYSIKEENKEILVKQLNAYFIEPKSRNFYQLSLSTGLINGLENDIVEREMEVLFTEILEQIKYRSN